MKIVTILGARPQFIKASSLSREIAKHNNIEEIIIHTGQHFDENMSKIFFEEMEIPKPKYNLEINSLSHGAMTGRMLEEIEKVLLVEKPNWVVIFGDTNSTIAGALAARKLQIKVPEEINRILTDQISDVLFCPTQTAINNLNNEGFETKNIEIVNSGDIMYDSAMYYKAKMQKPKSFITDNDFILATIHRQENTDNKEKLTQIITSFNELHANGTCIVLPLHPRTKKLIEKYNLKPKFIIIEPVGYLEMVYLLDNCKLVITDSGGLQKEAYFFNKYCITLRDTTEWVELIEKRVNILMNIDSNLTENIKLQLDNTVNNKSQLYGDGNSAKKIIENLIS